MVRAGEGLAIATFRPHAPKEELVRDRLLADTTLLSMPWNICRTKAARHFCSVTLRSSWTVHLRIAAALRSRTAAIPPSKAAQCGSSQRRTRLWLDHVEKYRTSMTLEVVGVAFGYPRRSRTRRLPSQTYRRDWSLSQTTTSCTSGFRCCKAKIVCLRRTRPGKTGNGRSGRSNGIKC